MMEHKGFLFDYDSFDRELRAILECSLLSGDSHALVSFINAHLGELRDPDDGEPLRADWQQTITTPNAHQYGDIALTKYYNPNADIGLGSMWTNLQDLIAADQTCTESPILGQAIGPKDIPFDPGKMGAYFQTPIQVRQHYCYMVNRAAKAHQQEYDRAIAMLGKALTANAGLYVTF